MIVDLGMVAVEILKICERREKFSTFQNYDENSILIDEFIFWE